MSYKEVLSLLPDEKPIDPTSGRKIISSEDEPIRDARITSIFGKASISGWVLEDRLVRYSVKYFTSVIDKDFHIRLKDELFMLLGTPDEKDISAEKVRYAWIGKDKIQEYDYDPTALHELTFTVTKTENFQKSGELRLNSNQGQKTAGFLLPEIFFQLEMGMSKAEVLALVPDATPANLSSSKNLPPSEDPFYLSKLSENKSLIIYFYEEKLDGMLISYVPPDDKFELQLLNEVIGRFGAPAQGSPYDRKKDELIWYIDGMEYTCGGSSERDPHVMVSVKARNAKYQPLRNSSQTATAPEPKKKDDTFVHPTFWQLRPGMSWAAALSRLPGAKAYSSLDGKFPPLSSDRPRDDLACKISTNEVIIVSFKDGRIASASLHLYNPDLEYYEALAEELRDKLGRSPEKLLDKKADTAGLRWRGQFLTYECLLDPRGDLVVSTSSTDGLSEKSKARAAQKANTK